MKTVDIKLQIRALEAPEPDAVRVDETLTLCRREYARRRRLRRVGAWELIRRQLRFTALPVWGLQAALLAAICCVFGAARPKEELIPASASLAAVLAALTLLPFHGRARRCGMEEVEAASRLSRAKLALARLGAVGAGDAVCCAAAALMSGGGWYVTLVFVATPFLLTSAVSLAALGHSGRESGVYIAAGLGAIIAIGFYAAAARFGHGLIDISPLLAAGLCLAALAALALELYLEIRGNSLEKRLGYEY